MAGADLNFIALHDCLTAAGCEVGVELLDDGEHAIVVTAANGRELRAPVQGDFDRAAAVIVLSGKLRHQCGTGDVDSGGWFVHGAWPELDALWRETVA